jgi:hypothetical protein
MVQKDFEEDNAFQKNDNDTFEKSFEAAHEIIE